MEVEGVFLEKEELVLGLDRVHKVQGHQDQVIGQVLGWGSKVSERMINRAYI